MEHGSGQETGFGKEEAVNGNAKQPFFATEKTPPGNTLEIITHH